MRIMTLLKDPPPKKRKKLEEPLKRARKKYSATYISIIEANRVLATFGESPSFRSWAGPFCQAEHPLA